MRKRHTYWLAEAELRELERRLATRRPRLTPIRGVPCKGLNDVADASFVAPEVWDQVCRRQGSWYRGSPKAGLFLVVADEPVDGLEERLETTVEPCDFSPPRLAGERDALEMAGSDAFARRVPEGWARVAEREAGYWRRLLANVGAEGGLDRRLVIHSANHANFIEPRFRVDSGGAAAPYSIARTADVCSACVELFNILGDEFPVKYVMPCPGFVRYAGGEADRYLLVRTPVPHV